MIPHRERVYTQETALRRLREVHLVAPARPWTSRNQGTDANLPTFRAVPRAFGQLRVYPQLIAPPRLGDASGNSRPLLVAKSFGPGPLQVSDLRFGDELLWTGRLKVGAKTKCETISHGDIYYELLEGRVGDAGLKMFPLTVEDFFPGAAIPTKDGNGLAQFASHVGPKSTTTIIVSVVFPTGISLYKKVNGKWVWVKGSVSLRVYLGAKGSDPYYVPHNVQGVNDNNRIDETWSMDVASGTYTVGLQLSWVSDSKLDPKPVWARVQSLSTAGLPPGAAGHAVLVVAGDLAGMGNDQYLAGLNCTVIPELKEKVGGGVVAGTRAPSAAMLEVLQKGEDALPDARIDSGGIGDWADDCATRGLRFDFCFGQDGGQAAKQEALRLIAAAGRARYIIRDGLHSVVREPTGSSVQMFCPTTMRSGFRAVRSWVDDLHAIRCKFRNGAKLGAEETIYVYAPGFGPGTATLFEDWQFDGTTERARVEDLANYHLTVLADRSRVYEFPVDVHVLRCQRGDLARVQHDVPGGWGLASGRIAGVSGTKGLELVEEVVLEVGQNYQVRLQRTDLTDALFDVVTVPGRTRSIRTTADHGAAAGDLFFFGYKDADSQLCVVLKVEPEEELRAKLTVAVQGAALSPGSGVVTKPSDKPKGSAIDPPTGTVSKNGKLTVSIS